MGNSVWYIVRTTGPRKLAVTHSAGVFTVRESDVMIFRYVLPLYLCSRLRPSNIPGRFKFCWPKLQLYISLH